MWKAISSLRTARTGALRARAWSVRHLSFNKERLEFDVTSDESERPEIFDDWGSDLDVTAGRIDRIRRERKVDETGAAMGKGKRKRAQVVAKIREGDGEITVNGKPHVEYFQDWGHRAQLLVPFEVLNLEGKFDVELEIKGGGPTGQSEAAKLAISKVLITNLILEDKFSLSLYWDHNQLKNYHQALQNFEPNHRTKLKREFLLSTDVRRVQPKKWGKTKARRAWQWVKR